MSRRIRSPVLVLQGDALAAELSVPETVVVAFTNEQGMDGGLSEACADRQARSFAIPADPQTNCPG